MFNPFIKKTRQKNFLLELWIEINTNLERFYVISQREFISSAFDLQAWDEAKLYSGFIFPTEVLKCAAILENFNRTFAEMRTFEEFYSSSIDNKTRANAEILHAKKEQLEEQVKVIEDAILLAQKNLRTMLDKQ